MAPYKSWRRKILCPHLSSSWLIFNRSLLMCSSIQYSNKIQHHLWQISSFPQRKGCISPAGTVLLCFYTVCLSGSRDCSIRLIKHKLLSPGILVPQEESLALQRTGAKSIISWLWVVGSADFLCVWLSQKWLMAVVAAPPPPWISE